MQRVERISFTEELHVYEYVGRHALTCEGQVDPLGVTQQSLSGDVRKVDLVLVERFVRFEVGRHEDG